LGLNNKYYFLGFNNRYYFCLEKARAKEERPRRRGQGGEAKVQGGCQVKLMNSPELT
jgi:hypothetical protein